TIDSIRVLKSQGLKVTMSNALMTVNGEDQARTHAPAHEQGVSYSLAPTVATKLDGDESILRLRGRGQNRHELINYPKLLVDVEGSMRGPSSADGGTSFHRTGIPSANMLRKASAAQAPLVQILPMMA